MLSPLLTWVHAACPSEAVQRDILAQARAADEQKRDCHFAIGGKLTRSRQAYLVHSVGGETFVFNLTKNQAKVLGVDGASMNAVLDGPREAPHGQLPIHLEHAEIDRSDRLNPSAPIAGRCTYRTEGPWPQDICLQLVLVVRSAKQPDATRRLALYCYPPMLPPSETLPFEFSPLSRPDGDDPLARPETAAAFLRFCTRPDPNRGKEAVPLSNAHGILVTLR